MNLFQLVAKLGLDTSEYESGIGKSRGMMKQLGQSVSASTIAMGNLIAAGVQKTFDVVTRLGTSSVQSAAELAAQTAQFEAAFGELQAAASGAFAGIAKDTNILERRLQAVGTKAFAQFKGAGLDAASSLSSMDKYTRLAADAAAYYDMSLEDADTRLRSFLRGNTEAGDMIGLFTSETQRDSKAVEVYGQKFQKLTEAQKQMLMLNIADEIYTQSNVLGQAEREGHEYLNVTENLKNAWEKLKGVFGTSSKDQSLPFMEKLTTFFSDDVILARVALLGQSFGEFVGKSFDGAIAFIDKVLAWSSGDEEFKLNIDLPSWEELKTGASEKLEAIKTGLSAALTWTLGAFTVEGMSVNEIVTRVGAWWTGQGNGPYERLKSVIKWTLGKWIEPEASSYMESIEEWWTNTGRPSLTSAVQWTFGEWIAPLWADLATPVYNWWNNDILPMLTGEAKWTLGELILPDVSAIIGKIQNWWSGVKAGLSLSFSASYRQSFSQSDIDAAMKENADAIDAISSPSVAPWASRKATGLGYVPYNEFPAFLHKGETVLSRADAEDYRAGRTGGAVDYEAIGEAVGNAVRAAFAGGIKLGVGDREFDAYITEAASRGIALEMHRRRYST